ncbi:flagellar export chaperone FliS [Candidatus Methylomirabilis sp.]|uniref:flagellar export chaperone FliS n=1 Tax=Candidatus Methylomirabilis sp. TaxID=2032687 RepID=UPI002A64A178|nr:flagellar protein FliS [Candidatus Methylomirabilis sp.]
MTPSVSPRSVSVEPDRLPAVYFAVNPMASYQSAQVLGASPMQLILIVYDLALTACGRRDTERARRAITELIAALNFDYQEIAVPLFRLYEYCLSTVSAGSFHEASNILRQLKEAWETALKESGQPSAFGYQRLSADR